MIFNHKLFNLKPLSAETTERGRFYTTPEGNIYPSVTTVLGFSSDKSGLEKWKKRVGEEEAKKISGFAASRGTAVHNLCEQYLKNTVPKGMPSNMELFSQIKKVLDKHVNNIMSIEDALYSDTLKVAGRVDLIAEYDGENAIIDFKTSGKDKREDWIEGYFLQCSLYAFMFWELTSISIKKIVIIIGNDSDNKAQVFVKSPNDYIQKAINMVKLYHKEN